jgi:hypothetical protein
MGNIWSKRVSMMGRGWVGMAGFPDDTRLEAVP